MGSIGKSGISAESDWNEGIMTGLFLWQSSKPPEVYLVVYFSENLKKTHHYGVRVDLEKMQSRRCLLFDRGNVKVYCIYFDTLERAKVDTFC